MRSAAVLGVVSVGVSVCGIGWAAADPGGAKGADDCAGGLVLDDGTLDTGGVINPVDVYGYVQRFTIPFEPYAPTALCLRLSRADYDGPSLAPGTVLGVAAGPGPHGAVPFAPSAVLAGAPEGEAPCAACPADGAPHSADPNGDWQISLGELLRTIQFFNSSGYHCSAGTEDGYAPGPGDEACAPHDGDYNPQDWTVRLTELLRLIQFFNTKGYRRNVEAVEGELEDGFQPGHFFRCDADGPVIALNGGNPLEADCGSSFSDPGAAAADACYADVAYTVSGAVDTAAPGEYTLIYEAMDGSGNAAQPAVRTVIVADATPPAIVLSGGASVTIACGEDFIDPGATASDNCDPEAIVAGQGMVDPGVPGDYTLVYEAVDAAGNAAQPVTRTVTVMDDVTPPVITLPDPAKRALHLNIPDNLGATAEDNCDPAPVIAYSRTPGPLDLSAVYTVTVTATDASGNTSIEVVDQVPVRRPNMLFLNLDDLNDWVGYLEVFPNTGPEANPLTPALDALAESSAVFTHAYCAAPMSAPSRAAVVTGRHPANTGIYYQFEFFRATVNGSAYESNLLALPRYLFDRGYNALGAAKIALDHRGPDVAWHEWMFGNDMANFYPAPGEDRYFRRPPEPDIFDAQLLECQFDSQLYSDWGALHVVAHPVNAELRYDGAKATHYAEFTLRNVSGVFEYAYQVFVRHKVGPDFVVEPAGACAAAPGGPTPAAGCAAPALGVLGPGAQQTVRFEYGNLDPCTATLLVRDVSPPQPVSAATPPEITKFRDIPVRAVAGGLAWNGAAAPPDAADRMSRTLLVRNETAADRTYELSSDDNAEDVWISLPGAGAMDNTCN